MNSETKFILDNIDDPNLFKYCRSLTKDRVYRSYTDLAIVYTTLKVEEAKYKKAMHKLSREVSIFGDMDNLTAKYICTEVMDQTATQINMLVDSGIVESPISDIDQFELPITIDIGQLGAKHNHSCNVDKHCIELLKSQDFIKDVYPIFSITGKISSVVVIVAFSIPKEKPRNISTVVSMKIKIAYHIRELIRLHIIESDKFSAPSMVDPFTNICKDDDLYRGVLDRANKIYTYYYKHSDTSVGPLEIINHYSISIENLTIDIEKIEDGLCDNDSYLIFTLTYDYSNMPEILKLEGEE